MNKKFKSNDVQLTKTYTNQVILCEELKKFYTENARIFILRDAQFKIEKHTIHTIVPMTIENYTMLKLNFL